MPARPPEADPAAIPPGLDPLPIRVAVLDWYERTGRSLPFRGATDPWAILVSEAMAQQTQADRAGEAWTAFMAVYPRPASLAAASPAEVLRAWRGLGYNRRAIALRAAAIAIVREHDGHVPDDLDALRRLPGVGPYTARAVAALAFRRPVGAVDTNVRRVLTRFAPPPLVASPACLQAFADALVDPARPGEWTHALMDVGARVCRTRPACGECPLATWCASRQRWAAAGSAMATRPTYRAATDGGRVRAAHAVSARERPAPFATTTRWLRGRIVDRLRDGEDGAWVRLDEGFGQHDAAAVAAALEGLETDGLVERHAVDPALARLPATVSEPGTER
ncbi:MAG TPA: A/G-specific adenine glycosylase [Candidatus Dormibacteraeota bacterium]|nr:A/G-specific adenine glycosylase [Candidatus Dormibacteraeota bacterium]